MKKVLWLLLAAVLALGVVACGDDLDDSNDSGSSGSSQSSDSGSTQSITVGSANFPENVVLAEIYAGRRSRRRASTSRRSSTSGRARRSSPRSSRAT